MRTDGHVGILQPKPARFEEEHLLACSSVTCIARTSADDVDLAVHDGESVRKRLCGVRGHSSAQQRRRESEKGCDVGIDRVVLVDEDDVVVCCEAVPVGV